VDRSDLPADIARLLGRLRDALLARGGLAGIYLYGSLATGDFSPARSDIDLVRQRVRRAQLARQIMRHGVSRLSNQQAT
jgi:predicted nucleotidyltransferase